MGSKIQVYKFLKFFLIEEIMFVNKNEMFEREPVVFLQSKKRHRNSG
jgi:hypothetical protein